MKAPSHNLNSTERRGWFGVPSRMRDGSGATSSRKCGAFTLVEIMVTVALLAVIILGLVAMFNQTRRAFTSSLTQVDVLESGRAAADLVGREMEQMAASGWPQVT